GQHEAGGPLGGWGTGRAWPLLTGERGHYELAAGRDVVPFLKAMERFATVAGLLPEQVWDRPDLPGARMYLGRPTGSPMPLMWAPAEDIKLLRSRRDGQIFDRIPAVRGRGPGGAARAAVERGRALQPARPLGTRRDDAAHPGGGAVPSAMDRRRVGRHRGRGVTTDGARHRLRGHSRRPPAGGPHPVHVLLARGG